jgi:hypothetical protein
MFPPTAKLPTFGPRELAFNMMMSRLKFIGGLMAFFVIFVILLIFSREQFHSAPWVYYSVDWIFVTFEVIMEALLSRDEWMVSLIALVGVACVIGFFWLVLTLIEKAPSCTALNLKDTALPSVLRILLKPKAPFVMVSYTWRSPYSIKFARSLAYSLPEVWCVNIYVI